jgi:hypothetical protein
MKTLPTKYIGYHKGDIHDGYTHSSENKTFQNLFTNSKVIDVDTKEPDFYESFVYEWTYNPTKKTMSRKILKYGDDNEMYSEESKLHKSYDVENNPDYFNLKNSCGPWKSINIDDLNKVAADIRSGKYTKDKQENIEDLYNELIPNRIQPRRDEDSKFVKGIGKDIRAAKNTDDTEPIRVKLDKHGKRRMFDGNTTLLSSYNVKRHLYNPTLKVDEIPYEISKNFTDKDFETLGNLLNKKQKIQKRACTAEDVAYDIYQRHKKHGLGIKSTEAKEIINSSGWGNRKKEVYSIIQNWIDTGNVITSTYVNYTLAPNKPKLTKVENKYRNKDTHVITCSSGKFGDATLNKWLSENTNYGRKKPTKTKLKIVIYHPKQANHIAWDKQLATKTAEVEYLCKMCNVEFLGFFTMDTHN